MQIYIVFLIIIVFYSMNYGANERKLFCYQNKKNTFLLHNFIHCFSCQYLFLLFLPVFIFIIV
jgi:hypothetical protein